MEQKEFTLFRDFYGQDSQKRETTLGKLNKPDESFFGFTLEDVVRPFGIKKKKYTAIPETSEGFTYKLGIRYSPSRKRDVVVIYTRKEGDVYILEHNGKVFTYTLFHGGNHPDDTEGCVLIARNRVTDHRKMSIQGSLEAEMTAEVKSLIDQGFDPRLKVVNLPQSE